MEVSTTTNPVTVTADVAVNNASRNGVISFFVFVKGRLSNRVPIAIRKANPPMSIYGEPKFRGGRRIFESCTMDRCLSLDNVVSIITWCTVPA